MTIRQLLADLSSAFSTFEDPKLEARHLMLEAMDMDLSEMILRGDDPVPQVDRAKIEMWKLERLKGMPLAYLTGRKAFFKSEFIVRPGVLVPRPETELVVETALLRLSGARYIADFGCGSGCIGLSLLQEWSQAKLLAIDQSKVATEVTRENALKLHLLERVEFVNKSVEEWDRQDGPVGFDLVVANPPYIAVGDPRVQKSVHDFEPHEALYASDEGLAAIREWLRVAFVHLRPGGLCVMEIGSGQSKQVQAIMTELGFQEIQVTKDLNQIERVISALR